MKRFVVLEKTIGETPLTVIQKWKQHHPAYATVKASYAGRLDPMASGKLLILIGEECKRQKLYTGLDKEYEIEVLLDIGSDTGDVLGLVTYADTETHPTDIFLKKILAREHGARARPYPAFSSKTVNGKPLFLHTLEDSLAPGDLPTHIEKIYTLQHRDTYLLSSEALQKRVATLLTLVPHTDEPSKRLGEDFRIDAVREGWQTALSALGDRTFTVLRLRVTCASGTYMRSLAGRIGGALGTHALALSIKRTTIGRYIPLWRSGFWLRIY